MKVTKDLSIAAIAAGALLAMAVPAASAQTGTAGATQPASNTRLGNKNTTINWSHGQMPHSTVPLPPSKAINRSAIATPTHSTHGQTGLKNVRNGTTHP